MADHFPISRIEGTAKPVCPHCGATHSERKDYAKHAGGTVGLVAGGVAGITGAASGAEIGGLLGLSAGPVGFVVGSMTGALIGCLVGASAGCVAGAKLGEVIDHRVLRNHLCLECGCVFSAE